MAQKTQTPPPSTGDRFFGWLRSLGIQREPGWIGGVAAGISARLGIDPLIVRGILVVVAVLGGPALLLYAAAWLLLPDRDDTIHLEQLIAGKAGSAIAGIGVLVLLSLLPLSQGFWFAGAEFWGQPNWGAGFGRVLWTLAILGAAVALVIWISQRGNAPTVTKPGAPVPPAPGAPASDFADWRAKQAEWKAETAAFRSAEANAKAEAWRVHHAESLQESAKRRAERSAEYRRSNPHPLFSILVIGVALVAGGLTTLLVKAGELQVESVVAGLAVALGVLALGVVANGVRGKRGGAPSGLAGFILLPLIFFVVVPQTSHVEYFNGATFTPTANASGAPDFYFVGAGDSELDLSEYFTGSALSSNAVTHDVYLFAGDSDVHVRLPERADVIVDARVGGGSVYLLSADGGRTELDDEYRHDDPRYKRMLEVRIFLGAGDVSIDEIQEDSE